MRKLLVFGIAIFGLSLGLLGPAAAENISIAPSGSAATTVDGAARLAFHFDVSRLQGVDFEAGRTVYFEWMISGVPSNDRSEYAVYSAGDSWESAGDVAGLELGDSPVDTWDIEVMDYERAGGLVRLNVTSVVQAWLDDDSPNNGLVFTTADISANSLAGQFSGARLVLR